jgi:pilus assembly protein CpaB
LEFDMFFKNWRKVGVVLLLLCTLLAGVLGAFGARTYVQRSLDNEISLLRAGEEEVEVIVANRPLRSGERIDFDKVAVRSIPKTYLDALAISPEAFEEVAGRYLLFPVESGRALLLSHIAQAHSAGFAERLPENERAVTFSVDSNNTLSGLLKAGDWVDILLTYSDAERSRTALLLEKVRILATGDDLGLHFSERERHFYEVTVSLSPKDAARLVHAESLGKFSLVLRSPEASGERFTDAIDQNNLLGAPKRVRGRPAVTIITGRGATL